MSREEWRNKIAALLRDEFGAWERTAGQAAVAVLALIEAEGRVLWWCPDYQVAVDVPGRCFRAKHRRGVFIELDKP